MPPALDHVVKKCLEKDPDDRWQSAHDVASELRWIGEAGSQAGVPATLSLRRRSRERLAWGLALAFAAAGAGGLGWALHLRGALHEADRPFRVELVPPPEIAVAPVVQGALALSPDGRRMAFVAARHTRSGLASGDLATGENEASGRHGWRDVPVLVPRQPMDRASFRRDASGRSRPRGGRSQAVCDGQRRPRGKLGPGRHDRLRPRHHWPAREGPRGRWHAHAPRRHVAADVTHRNPWFLPDGRHFLFTVRGSASARFGSIAVGSLEGGAATTAARAGAPTRSTPPVSCSSYRRQPRRAALRRREAGPAGTARLRSPTGSSIYNPRDLGQYSVSGAGLPRLPPDTVSGRRSSSGWIAPGRRRPPWESRPTTAPCQLGADGRTLAAVRSDAAGANADVWILDLQRAQVTRATFASAPSDLTAALSPDGARLAVSASSVGGWAGATLWIQPVSGSGSRQSLLEKVSFSVTGWSPDQAFLVGDTQQAGSGFDVAYVAMADPSKVVHVTTSRFNERDAGALAGRALRRLRVRRNRARGGLRLRLPGSRPQVAGVPLGWPAPDLAG